MLSKTEMWLRNVSDRTYIVILLVLMVFRVGPSPIGAPWVGWVYDAARAFPSSANYISYSPLPVLIAKIFGPPKVVIWWMLFGALMLVWFIAVMHKLKLLFPDHYRIVQLLFAASQVVMLQVTYIGHYDNISVIAASLVFLWNYPSLIYLAAFMAAGANPYMSLATAICLIVLYCGTKTKDHLKIGLIYFLVSIIILLGSHFWMDEPAGGTRQSIVLGELGSVIRGSLGVWGFIFLSVLGPLWFVFIWFLVQRDSSLGQFNSIRKFFIFMGVAGIPMGMSFFILDHTRLGVVVGCLPLFLFLLPELKQTFGKVGEFKDIKFPILSGGILIWILYPTIIVDTAGVFRLPFAKFISLMMGS
jgi:hypothetical protein